MPNLQSENERRAAAVANEAANEMARQLEHATPAELAGRTSADRERTKGLVRGRTARTALGCTLRPSRMSST